MREIKLSDIIKVILDKVVFIAVVFFLTVSVTAYVNWNVLPKTYSARTTMFVLNRTSSNGVSYSDINTSTSLVNDYQAFATSARVKQGAARATGVDISGYTVTVSSKMDTRIITVSVVGLDPVNCAKIANAIAKELSVCILDFMQVENISIIDAARVPAGPSGPTKTSNLLLAAGASLLASIGILIVIELANTTIRTKDDIEKILGLPVLVQVPVVKEKKNGGEEHE